MWLPKKLLYMLFELDLKWSEVKPRYKHYAMCMCYEL